MHVLFTPSFRPALSPGTCLNIGEILLDSGPGPDELQHFLGELNRTIAMYSSTAPLLILKGRLVAALANGPIQRTDSPPEGFWEMEDHEARVEMIYALLPFLGETPESGQLWEVLGSLYVTLDPETALGCYAHAYLIAHSLPARSRLMQACRTCLEQMGKESSIALTIQELDDFRSLAHDLI
ncbi:hypothetical protein [Pontibacter sp. G13]|uniref:hypothetical protein n=1 Tax=Pontibacter sp. G13 TaxID=3074898 RepID=UPI00288B7C17|nr:hypothetical protein [Pontibacter sp. G13]WNJ17269.1 hypothetical protein RJD25_20655 [Pontibacter sp. G13]